jgi:hypothetical protein
MTGKQYTGRPVESLTPSSDQGVKLALHALNVFLGGKVICVIGANYDGAIWCVPSPDVPNNVLQEALDADWAANVRMWSEWRT